MLAQFYSTNLLTNVLGTWDLQIYKLEFSGEDKQEVKAYRGTERKS